MTKLSPFRDPGVVDGERSTYAAKLGGKPFTDRITNVIAATEKTYRSTTEARIAERFQVSVEQDFERREGRLHAERYKAESRFDDELVTREEGFFGATQHLHFGGELAPFPGGLMPLVGGLTLLRGLEFTRGAKTTVDLWLAFSVYVPLDTKVEKRTTVEVPAGRFDAWQVRVRPSLRAVSVVLDTVVAGLLPPFVMHFEAAAPHRMLSFTFPTGPMPWNARGEIELVA